MKIKIVAVNKEDIYGDNLSKRAWQYSRNDDDTALGSILSLDLPVNEMSNVVVEVESTIMEREVIASMRDHHMWARSSRVDNPLSFRIPDILKANQDFKEHSDFLRGEMVAAKKNGIRQDEYRTLMPIYAETRYTLSMNMRSLVTVYNYFKHLQEECKVIELEELYDDAAHAFRFILRSFARNVEMESLLKKPFKEVLPEKNNISSGSSSNGDFISYSGTVPFSLRTHLIRHRMIFMVDNIKKLITGENVYRTTLATPVHIGITSSHSFWKEIITTRSCWLIHYAMWKPIIKVISHEISGIDESILPCSGNGSECCYEKDNIARLQHKDPNPPCPIYVNHEKIVIDEVLKQRTSKQFALDARPLFWTKHIGELK